MQKKIKTLDELMREEDEKRIAEMNSPEALKREEEAAGQRRAKREREDARLAAQIAEDHAAGLCDEEGNYHEDEDEDEDDSELD